MRVSLNDLEEKIYKDIFSSTMSRRTFKHIISKATLRIKGEGNYIMQKNEAFIGVYLIVLMNKNYEIQLLKDDRELYRVSQGDWIGLIEYDAQRKLIENGKEDLHKWDITGRVIKRELISDRVTEDYTKNKKIYDKYKEPCYIYEFNFHVILYIKIGFY